MMTAANKPLVLALLAALALGCGDPELQIRIVFPDATARAQAYRIALYAHDASGQSCADVLGKTSFTKPALAQTQIQVGLIPSGIFPQLPVRPLLISAIVYNSSMQVILVGCTAAEPEPGGEAQVVLGCAPGVPYLNGRCCQPTCTNKSCGADDGCGQPCQTGRCSPTTWVCQAGQCVCAPSCTGKACGASDGCGGLCQTGSCSGTATCVAGTCVCPSGGVQCSSTCCGAGQVCTTSYQCCTPACTGRICGPDPSCGVGYQGSGASACGTCPSGKTCNAQGQCEGAVAWTPVSSGVSVQLNDLWGANASDLWAVGGNGTILRWNGAAWSKASSGTTANLTDIVGLSANQIWAVGEGGTILRWNGASWSAESSGLTTALHGVAATASTLYAVGVGGKVLTSTGGAWSPLAAPSTATLTAGWLSTGAFFAVGSSGSAGVILRYDAATWTPETSGTAETLYGVWGASAAELWAVGTGGTILRRTGTAWSSVSSGTTAGLMDLWGSSANDVWAVGGSGTILHWDGSAWSKENTASTATLHGVFGSSASDVWAVGSGGVILRHK